MSPLSGRPTARGVEVARLLTWLVCAVATTGCVGYRAVNAPLAEVDPDRGYRLSNVEAFREHGSVSIYLAFSGGGTRAAAFAYGVLETLRDQQVLVDGRPTRLLDKVDTLSGVSGGSFPAAYYGLFGDRIFDEFESRFLRRNIEGAIIWRVFWPWNAVALLTPWMNRSDIAKGIYHGSVYDEATFADLERAHGPRVYINATDVVLGERFLFTQDYFDAICSDLAQLPIAYAVAASSAVPALLSPVSFRSRAGTCGYEVPGFIRDGLEMRETDPRRYRATSNFVKYSNPDKRFVHLVDGGISDNLGLRAGLDSVSAAGGLRESATMHHVSLPKHLVVISVNAETEPPHNLDLSAAAPGVTALLNAVSGAQIRRYNFETLLFARDAVQNWVSEVNAAGADVTGYVVEVSFDNIEDPERRHMLKALPTNFSLSDEQVDDLRSAARELLEQSPDFRRLLRALGQP